MNPQLLSAAPATNRTDAHWYQRGYRLSWRAKPLFSVARLLAGRSTSRPQEPLMSLLVSRRM